MSSTSATRVASARSAVGASSGFVLRVRDLHVDYAGALQALHGVSVDVPRGGVVAVLGANGAGKSTLLRAISGTLRFAGGRVVEGSVELDGIRLDAMDPAAVVRVGRGAGAGGPPSLRAPHRRGEPTRRRSGHRRYGRVRRLASASMTRSRCSGSAPRSGPACSRVANSRCWRSRGR